jgi:hypothetical protein
MRAQFGKAHSAMDLKMLDAGHGTVVDVEAGVEMVSETNERTARRRRRN